MAFSMTRCSRRRRRRGWKGGLAEETEQAEERWRALGAAMQGSVAREIGLGPLVPSQRKVRRWREGKDLR